MRKPRALQEGDLVGIAAASSPFEPDLFAAGIEAIERMGFGVRHREDLFHQQRYLAGSDERRAEELTELIEDDAVAAILFARGGYGCQRMIPRLDAARLRRHQKPIVGFSDVTALLTFLRQSAGFPTFYGPVITQLGREPDAGTAASLKAALTSTGPLGAIGGNDARVLKAGEAEGPLVGGCLSLIATSIGTPYQLELDGAILFVEDVGEKVYALDRMLTQLINAGMLRRARGIVIGSLEPLPNEAHDLPEMLADVLRDFAGPVVTGFPAGHTQRFVTLPLGVPTRIRATAKEGAPTITSLEGLLS